MFIIAFWCARAFSRVTNHNHSNNTSQIIVSIPHPFLLRISLFRPIIHSLRNVDREVRLVPVLRTDEFSAPYRSICVHIVSREPAGHSPGRYMYL